MMTTDRSSAARLLCVSAPDARGRRQPTSRPGQILAGNLDELVAHVDAQDREDLWRYTIVLNADDHHIRRAELRALMPTP
jgi:hypothetical protein